MRIRLPEGETYSYVSSTPLACGTGFEGVISSVESAEMEMITPETEGLVKFIAYLV